MGMGVSGGGGGGGGGATVVNGGGHSVSAALGGRHAIVSGEGCSGRVSRALVASGAGGCCKRCKLGRAEFHCSRLGPARPALG